MRDTYTNRNGAQALRLAADAKLECKICWHIYDPAEGDEVWQIPPNTAFSALPEHWSCPQCGSPKQGFLIMDA